MRFPGRKSVIAVLLVAGLGVIAVLLEVVPFRRGEEMPAATGAPRGRALYEAHCAVCHGVTGKGDGPAAVALTPKPKDLSETTKSDAELKAVISKGGAAVGLSPVMPAWGATVSEADITNLIAHIRSLRSVTK